MTSLSEQVREARGVLSRAIYAYHQAMRDLFPIGKRVKIVRGNTVRIGSVTEVSTHFVRVLFDGGKRPVWKNVELVKLEDAQ